MKFAMWNNKGGVGKSFLTFAIATEVAKKRIQNDRRPVLVIDMCPQANVSEMILGGNGEGSQHVLRLSNEKRTISDYFNRRLKSPVDMIADASPYFLRPNEYNKSIQDNLYLVPGNQMLERQVPSMYQMSLLENPVNSWIGVHSWVKDLIEWFTSSRGAAPTVFLDCNPSFSIYTRIALTAANRIILPCTPDGSSARAITNVAKLVYGHQVDSKEEKTVFSTRLKEAGYSAPLMHLFIMNRATMYGGGLAKVFAQMAQQLKNNVDELFQGDIAREMFSAEKKSDLFIEMAGGSEEQESSGRQDGGYADMPDAHSAGVVMAATGSPISSLNRPTKRVGKETVQINKETKAKYQEALGEIIDRLGI